MCKYCKNLKRIKDLEEKEYLDIIQKWRQRDKIAMCLIAKLSSYCLRFYKDMWTPYNYPNLYSEYLKETDELYEECQKFLEQEWIGK